MIIYVAPDDTTLYAKTHAFAQTNNKRLLVVDKSGFLTEVLQGSHPGMVGQSETVWLVGHGNEKEIGDKTSKGVTLKPVDVAALLKAVLQIDTGYGGSIVIDACSSGVLDDQRKTFADNVYDEITKPQQYPDATVGGWIGSATGPISGGSVKLSGDVFKDEAGFAWAHRTPPHIQDHDVLAKLT